MVAGLRSEVIEELLRFDTCFDVGKKFDRIHFEMNPECNLPDDECDLDTTTLVYEDAITIITLCDIIAILKEIIEEKTNEDI